MPARRPRLPHQRGQKYAAERSKNNRSADGSREWLLVDEFPRAEFAPRDLKSTNVFVGAEMNLKLGDLGIAKILESTLATRERSVVEPGKLLGARGRVRTNLMDRLPTSGRGVCLVRALCLWRRQLDASNLHATALELRQGRSGHGCRVHAKTTRLRLLVKRLLTKDAEQDRRSRRSSLILGRLTRTCIMSGPL